MRTSDRAGLLMVELLLDRQTADDYTTHVSKIRRAQSSRSGFSATASAVGLGSIM